MERNTRQAPPEDCPHGDVLEDLAPRGKFRIDRRLFIGVILLLIVIAYGGMPNEVWVVADTSGPPALRQGAAISSGEIELPPGAIADLQLGRKIRLRAWGPVKFYLPASPGRWFGRSRTLRLEEGKLLGTTGNTPLGFKLSIESGSTRLKLVGGTFLVERGSDATHLALEAGNMAVTEPLGFNAEELIGRHFTISENNATSRSRDINDRERREFAELVARGLPPLSASQD